MTQGEKITVLAAIKTLIEEGLTFAGFARISEDRKLAREIVSLVGPILEASGSQEKFVELLQKREDQADKNHAGLLKGKTRNTKG